MRDCFLIVDGNSLMHRAFHALPVMDAGNGIYTNAIHGFLNMLLKVVKEENVRYLAVCFDEHGPTFRHTAYADYKAGRSATPEELRQQLKTIREVLTAMGVRWYAIQGWEADDLQGTLSRLGVEAGVAPLILSGDRDLLLTAAFLTSVGFGCKAGMVPLQMWLTEAHPVAPSPASAVLSGLITKGGVIAIIRSVFYLFGAEFIQGTWVQSAVLVLSVITIFMGSMLALREKLLKKRLAYSTISNVSYVIFGLFTFTAAGFTGALLQVVFHALAKDVLFLAAGSVIFATGYTKVDELKGVGRRMPVTMWCFAVAALSLIGIPPAGGFAAKWYLAIGALENGAMLNTVGVVVLMVSALLTAFYLLPIVADAFFPGKDFVPEERIMEVPAKMLVPLIVFCVLIIVLGILPSGMSGCFDALAGKLI